MPLPKPRQGETQDDFISRCMGDETTTRDFPDDEQRSAVCFRQWRERTRGAMVDDMPDTPACFRAHMGLWAIDPYWMTQAVQAIQAGLWPLRALAQEPQALSEEDRRGYFKTGDIAILRLVGSLSKGWSKFGGTSTIGVRRGLRQAMADEEIGRIMLAIDSPGGQVAGITELVDAVHEASLRKPVAAYIEDLGASAAYWVASQAQRITSNRVAEIGSIGVLALLEDTSGRAERMGIKVHVISTGPYKGLGAPGQAVLPEHLLEVQSRVDAIAEHFFAAVKTGRQLSQTKLDAVTDGRVYTAQQAVTLGLSDGIESFEEALATLAKMRPRRRGMRSIAALRQDAADRAG